METHNQDNSPSVELPNDENKLFDEADDVGNSTIPDLSLPMKLMRKNIPSTMCGNMLSMTFSSYQHLMLKEKV